MIRGYEAIRVEAGARGFVAASAQVIGDVDRVGIDPRASIHDGCVLHVASRRGKDTCRADAEEGR